ncbi:MAG TPA: DUF1707 domain-containing protein [Streptosporangiaceae bacterium]|jgi:hypothetical protein|nr:DUF1707 domain-containing protein [Streptosporangiaceae bacterium]
MAELTREGQYSMSNPESPSQPTVPPRRAGWPGADMRVGDAERAEIADRLARHFSDGRLDEAEFGERLDRAMRAKTMADLSGLLSDLPGEEPAPPQQGGRRHERKMRKIQLERERLALRHEQRAHRREEREVRWRTLRWIPLFVGVLVGAVIVAHTLMHSFVAWLVIGVIAFLWVRRNAMGSHHDHSHHGDSHLADHQDDGDHVDHGDHGDHGDSN